MSSLNRITRAGAIVVAAAALAATAAGAASANPFPSHPSPDGAVFVQTDDPAGNAVVAYDRGPDGALHQAGVYPTGGRGGVLAGSVVDHLASQGSLTYDRDAGLLYAVNAGSDTLTVFGVSGDRLVRREVLPTLGDFPVSVAVHGDLVYVLNARGGGSIQGYRRVGPVLVPVPFWHRGLGLDPHATPEFTSTPGQVTFTPDGQHLLVTTKANTNAIEAFGVDRLGGVSARPVVTTLPGAVPFATSFDAAGHLAVAEAGPNAVATFAVNSNGTLTGLTSVPTGQAATCWVLAVGTTLYASNAGSGTLSELRDAPGAPPAVFGTVATSAGTVDAAASGDGRFVYVQGGRDGVVDAFRVGAGGALTAIGTVTVSGAAGGEGIAAS
jgi:6-phosphogluconolactonase (cycloisomerase 2 family)